ncbi:MAG TPA: hypothetical protein VIK59_08420 [Verrucomicrobiae bacterium]
MNPFVTANGKPVAAQLPCALEEFLVAQKLPPRNNGNHSPHLPILRRRASL